MFKLAGTSFVASLALYVYAQPDAVTQTILDLALASNILAQQSVCAFPLVLFLRSYRSGLLHSRRFWSHIGPASYELVALFSVAQSGTRAGFIERFINSELYKAFADNDQVQSVAHFHAKEVLPFSVLPPETMPFRAVNHLGSFLGAAPAPNFDIAAHFGAGTDMLVRSPAIGSVLAQTFVPSAPAASSGINSTVLPFVLMRGHGGTVVAPTIQLAVFRSVYTKVTAEVLAQTAGMGSVQFMSAEECEAATATLSGQAPRAFNLWSAQVAGGVPEIVPS